jgi:uncharacterized damage-inducible protein DinB
MAKMRNAYTLPTLLLLGSLAGGPALAADPIADVFDNQVRTVEREILGLAQKMPADKYNFAPTNGTFTGVRTFGEQVKHIATVIYMVGSAVLGEKMPVDEGENENGPASLRTKDQILEYFRNSLAYAHKAMATLTVKNQLDPVNFGGGRPSPRISAAAFLGQHSFDHYGQMVVYARMNGVVPGGGPPPPPAGKAKGK